MERPQSAGLDISLTHRAVALRQHEREPPLILCTTYLYCEAFTLEFSSGVVQFLLRRCVVFPLALCSFSSGVAQDCTQLSVGLHPALRMEATIAFVIASRTPS